MAVELIVNRPKGFTEARTHERVPASFPVRLKTPGLRLADEARDVSETGVGVLTKSPLTPMTVVPLVLEIPLPGGPIELMGRVMWSTPTAMGLKFEQLDPRLTDSVHTLRQALKRI
jgi:hypothetical protein